jgi:cell division protein FtsA
MKTSGIFALDLGTTKFCLAGFKTHAGHTHPQLHYVSVEAQGMRRGMVADLQKAQAALALLIDKTEDEINCDISHVVVGIAGSHIKNRTLTTTIPLASAAVDELMLLKLQEAARQKHGSTSHEFLHLLPLSYQLDNRGWIENPIGFTGQSLTASFLTIEADKNYLADVVRLCNLTGLTVKRLYAEPFASANVITSSTDSSYGLVSLDIGGGTTDGMIYIGGKPSKTFTVNIGGNLMTNDLSIGLAIPMEEAEKIKRSFDFNVHPGQQQLTLSGLNNEVRFINATKVYTILRARFCELAWYINQEITPFRAQLNSGIFLTGGGSQVKGLDQILHEQLHLAVSRRNPSTENFGIKLQNQQIFECKYATVLGLLALELQFQKHLVSKKHHFFFSGLMNQFVHWIKELS